MNVINIHLSRKPLRHGSSAGRPRNADKGARLANILRTAEFLFVEKGYGNVSLEAIAREAHVAVRTIYVKFGGKAGLLNAVITEGRARYFAGMTDMETDPRPAIEILTEFSVRFVELLSLPAFIKLHRMVIAEAQTTPDLALTFFRAGPMQMREQLGCFFRRADIAAQLSTELSPETLSIHLLNCLLGDQATRIWFEEDSPCDAIQLRANVAIGLKLFLNGARSANE